MDITYISPYDTYKAPVCLLLLRFHFPASCNRTEGLIFHNSNSPYLIPLAVLCFVNKPTKNV